MLAGSLPFLQFNAALPLKFRHPQKSPLGPFLSIISASHLSQIGMIWLQLVSRHSLKPEWRLRVIGLEHCWQGCSLCLHRGNKEQP